MKTEETAVQSGAKPRFRFTRKQSIGLVLGATIFGAAAQMLIKYGANNLASSSPIDMVTNPPLFTGYALYGIFTVLLVLALRDGELSILYPVISMTFAWVAILSVILLGERLNLFKVAGIGIIIVGVAILGRNSNR